MALREIDHFFKTKLNSIGDPEFYLGAKLRLMTLPNGVMAWGMSSSKYVQASVTIVKTYHAKENPTRNWEKWTSGPFPCDYSPELDSTNLLDYDKSAFYQSHIGLLRWIVKLGQIDSITEVDNAWCDAPWKPITWRNDTMHELSSTQVTLPVVDMTSFKTECEWKAF
jgi:hypothetical protein